MLLNCGARKDFWESLGQQGDHQSILKKINPECSLEGLMLKVQVQYFGHLMGTVDSLEKTLMLRKIKGRRRRGQQRLRWLDSITNPMDMSLTKFWKIVRDRGAWLAVVHGVAKSQTQLSDWTTATMGTESLFCSHNILVADPGFRPSCSLSLSFSFVINLYLLSNSFPWHSQIIKY